MDTAAARRVQPRPRPSQRPLSRWPRLTGDRRRTPRRPSHRVDDDEQQPPDTTPRPRPAPPAEARSTPRPTARSGLLGQPRAQGRGTRVPLVAIHGRPSTPTPCTDRQEVCRTRLPRPRARQRCCRRRSNSARWSRRDPQRPAGRGGVCRLSRERPGARIRRPRPARTGWIATFGRRAWLGGLVAPGTSGRGGGDGGLEPGDGRSYDEGDAGSQRPSGATSAPCRAR
jgi:hypothetical protein